MQQIPQEGRRFMEADTKLKRIIGMSWGQLLETR